MYVLDMATWDLDDIVRDACRALSAWYWLVKKLPFHEDDYAELRTVTEVLHVRLAAFEVSGSRLGTPKYHVSTKLDKVRSMPRCETNRLLTQV